MNFSQLKNRYGLLLGLATLAFSLALGILAQAQQPPAKAPPVRSTVNKKMGEGEVLRKRHEWFFSSRRAGAFDRMANLRKAAVDVSSEQLRLQRLNRRSPEGASTWTSKGPSSSTFGGWGFGKVSGRVIALAKDWTNNILYAGGASGGLWKSTDDGVSWTSVFETAGTLTVGAVTVDPNNPNTLWVGTGENSSWCEEYFGVGLLRSTDGGATWETRNGSGSGLENLSAFASVIVDPRDSNHIVAGGRYRDCVNGNYYYGGIYTSTDAGATWYNRMANAGVSEIVQDPVNRDIFWAAVENLGLYKSTNNGVTWTLQTASLLPTGSIGRTEVTVSPADSNYVYVLFGYVSGTSEVWRTTNGGASWTKRSSGSLACDGQCGYNMVIRAHLTDVNTIYRGTIHIFKSIDGGATWSDLSGDWGPDQKVHQDTHEFLMSPTDANLFYVGCDGGVWKSADGGASFTNLNSNLNLTQFYAIGNHPTNDNIILGGAQDNSSLMRWSSDTWSLQQVTGDGFVCHVSPSGATQYYIAGYPFDHGSGYVPSVYRSTSAFGPFTHISDTGNGIAADDWINWVTPYLMDPTNPTTMFLGTHRVYRSTNSGDSWTQVGPADMTGGGGTIISLEVNATNGSYVFAGTGNGKVWRSADGGTNWSEISSGLPARTISDIAGDPSAPAKAFCVVGGFGTAHIYEYTGSGSWVARGGGLPNVPANTVLMVNATDLYVGTDVGIYKSADRGANFTPFMDGMPLGLVITDLKYTPATGTLTAGTYGRGAWQYTITATPPQVEHSSHAIVDICQGSGAGSGDATVDVGEDVTLQVTLSNSGGTAATGVYAVLTTTTPGITIQNAVAAFPDIPPAGTGTSVAPHFVFSVAPSVPCGTQINFSIQASYNEGGWSSPFLVPVRPGSGSLLSEGFEGGVLPAGWTTQVFSGNAWSVTPFVVCSGTKSLRYSYMVTQNADSWVYTPGLALQTGNTYTLSFKQRVGGASYPEKLSVFVGGAADYTAMTSLLWQDLNLTNVTCQTRTATFTVPSNGTYYIGFHATSNMNMYAIGLDDVSLQGACTANTCTAVAPGETASSEANALKFLDGNPDILQWGTNTSASGYRLYRGVPSGLAGLTSSASDACLLWAGAGTGVQGMLTETPASGSFLWYLVTAVNAAGEGPAGNGTGGPRILNSTGDCP